MFFFIAVIFSFAFSIIKIRSYDLFYYLKVAEFEGLLNPIKSNFFSFSHPEYPYTNYSVLFSETVAFLNNYFGLNSLILFQAIIIAISFGLISSVYKNKNNFVYLFIVFLLSLFTLRERLLFRPHNLSYLFFSINLYLLLTKNKLNLPFLFLNQIFWVNTHNSFILGVINPILLYPVINESIKDHKKWFLLIITSIIGSLFSLHFTKTFVEIFNPFIGETKELFKILPIHEWQSIDLNLILSFYGLLVLISVFIIFKTKNYKILPFFIFYLVISIKYVRFIDYFALVTFLSSIICLSAQKQILESFKLKVLKTAFFLILLITCILNYFRNPLIPYGIGIANYFYPEKAIDFIKSNNIKGKIYNSYPFGGYIIYNLFPDCKPIIDGRLCYPLDFIKLYADSLENPYSFREIIMKYKPDIFLIDYNHPDIATFLDLMKDKYKLVFYDDNAMIFLENKKFYEMIKKHAYKFVSPQYVMGFSNIKIENLDSVTQEIKRNIDETNSNRSKVMLGNILLYYGKKEIAKEYFTKVIESDSPIGKAEAFNNMGIIYLENNEVDLAIKMFKKAIFYTKDFDLANLNLAEIYKEKRHYIQAFFYFFKYYTNLRKKGENITNDLKNNIFETGNLAIRSALEYLLIVFALYGIIYIIFIKKRKKSLY